jgi:hypothetical protein
MRLQSIIQNWIAIKLLMGECYVVKDNVAVRLAYYDNLHQAGIAIRTSTIAPNLMIGHSLAMVTASS